MSIRPVKQVVISRPTLEGAGVHLRRAFGFGNTSEFDPFLLLDDFRNDIPEDYLAGFLRFEFIRHSRHIEIRKREARDIVLLLNKSIVAG